MKKLCVFALLAVLTLGLLTGCRSSRNDMTTAPTTTAPTTRATTAPSSAPTTQPTTEMTTPTDTGMDILPDAQDTIDPSNGANDNTQGRSRAVPNF